jgi:hypothetical protein
MASDPLLGEKYPLQVGDERALMLSDGSTRSRSTDPIASAEFKQTDPNTTEVSDSSINNFPVNPSKITDDPVENRSPWQDSSTPSSDPAIASASANSYRQESNPSIEEFCPAILMR